MDEAGRGPLAGPVVAGVAILPHRPAGDWVDLVRDSKQLTPAQRSESFAHLAKEALCISAGVASHSEIDGVGIVSATRLAISRAIGAMPLQPQYLLTDAFPLPQVDIPQKAIVHGDALCLSIAAASVVAKVTRDRMMEEQDALFPGYGFARHKGYATPEHLRMLRKHGPCPIHRFSFSPVRDFGVPT